MQSTILTIVSWASAVLGLPHFDNYPPLDFPRWDDIVNETVGSGNWHNGSNLQAPDALAPNFIANNFGPKDLNSEGGRYKVVAPLMPELGFDPAEG
ncbi:hypothetical protein MPH_08401 [Macrophomina phaseolina MS6]|uniref:Uncharacterized protein n=1 Tax=Macrophomina phaseolina (strain MS6) TaxID=1126212 RepID=K2RNN4_MACPH|nr:hypothetical protein MPH_08401 [Macrophomina phaseolina MS6]